MKHLLIAIILLAALGASSASFYLLDLGPGTCGEDSFRPITLFGGDLSLIPNNTKSNESSIMPDNGGMMSVLSPGGGHGHGGGEYDPNADYTDNTKWSTYPQKSQNAHVVVGILTVFTLYIWSSNVIGVLSLSKAYMLTGLAQIAQGAYLLTWLFYLLHPLDLTALRSYVLNDVMELQHMAICSCLIAAGAWDLFLGIFLHFELPIFMDTYNRKIIRDSHGKIIQPNNLLFFQKYLPIIVTIAHVLNGSNFISHPQHSTENTNGHVLLGLTMMLGGISFYWVRVRHVCWKYFAQQVNPSLRFETHFTSNIPSKSDSSQRIESSLPNTRNTQNVNNDLIDVDNENSNNMTQSDEVWNVGTRYNIEDLQALANSQTIYRKKTFSLDFFDIFYFDDTKPKNISNHDEDEDNIDESINTPQSNKYYSKDDLHNEWNQSSILTVEYKKFNDPTLYRKYQWNSISNHSIVNYLYNTTQYIYHIAWLTKTRRELIAWVAAFISSINFIFIAWLLMTFIEPPIRLHTQHWYECFSEYRLVQLTFFINLTLSGLAGTYMFLTFAHHKRIINAPFLYRIPFFQKE